MSEHPNPTGPLLSIDEAMRLLTTTHVVIRTPADAALIAQIRENCREGMALFPGDMLGELPPPVGHDVVSGDLPRADMLALTVGAFVADSLTVLLRTRRETEGLLKDAPASLNQAARMREVLEFLGHSCVELGRGLTDLACSTKVACKALDDFKAAHEKADAKASPLTASPPESANGRPPIASFG